MSLGFLKTTNGCNGTDSAKLLPAQVRVVLCCREDKLVPTVPLLWSSNRVTAARRVALARQRVSAAPGTRGPGGRGAVQ